MQLIFEFDVRIITDLFVIFVARWCPVMENIEFWAAAWFPFWASLQVHAISSYSSFLSLFLSFFHSFIMISIIRWCCLFGKPLLVLSMIELKLWDLRALSLEMVFYAILFCLNVVVLIRLCSLSFLLEFVSFLYVDLLKEMFLFGSVYVSTLLCC